MITVMIVDDEYIAREDIKSLLPFETLGFQIVAEAENGKRGLEQFRKYKPQVVITDIKMPVLNGLDMALQIEQESPGVKFILLTAYSEFDYARKAILLGACSYILKHEIDALSLSCELEKIKAEVEARQAEENEARVHMLRNLIYIEQPDEHRQEEETLLTPGSSLLILVQIKRDSDRRPERDMRKTFLQDITTQLRQYEAAFFYTARSLYALILKLPSFHSEKRLHAFLDETALTLRLRVKELFKTNCEITVSRVWSQEISCRTWFKETYDRFLERLMFGGKPYYAVPPALPQAEEVKAGCRKELQAVCGYIEKGDGDKLASALPALMNMIKETNDMHLLAQAIAGISLSVTRITAVPCSAAEIEQNLKEAATAEDMIGAILQAVQAYRNETGIQYTPRVQRAISYIHENYNKEITLRGIAEVMDVSEIYASQYFKKETGVSYMDYLTDYRISIAKKLIKEDYKIYEVSEMVGYQTVQYFSRIFKKLTGYSPKEYYGVSS